MLALIRWAGGGVVCMAQEVDRIIDWRQKSDEAYALADRLRDIDLKELMLAIARGYAALAKHQSTVESDKKN